MSIRRIRRAVRESRYEFTTHALEEMDQDDLAEDDVRQTLLHGKLVAKLMDDPRGIRFVVRGRLEDRDIDTTWKVNGRQAGINTSKT